MFYFNGQRWVPFSKKITYTEVITDYDNDADRFIGKDNLQVTDNLLTLEELTRLEEMAHVESMSLSELIRYVKTGLTLEPPTKDMVEAKENSDETKLLQTVINTAMMPIADLMKMKILLKPHESGALLMAGSVVLFRGGLYVVKETHTASLDLPPDEHPELYLERIPAEQITTVDYPAWDPDTTYSEGFRVMYVGVAYECMRDNTILSPAEYPQGWKPV